MQKWLDRFRSAEGGGGGGGGGDNPPPGEGGTPPAGAPPAGGGDPKIGGADGGQISVYKPDGIDPSMVGQTDRETIDRLFKSNRGFRDAQASAPKPPEKADGYAFNWGERITKDFGGVAADDIVLGKFRELAHEHGFTQKQMDAVPKLLEFMAEKDLLDRPVDTKGLLKSLAPANFRGTPEEIEAKGGERLRTAETWIKQLKPEGGFSDGMKNELRLLTATADGIAVVERLMNAGFTQSVTPGGGGQQSGGNLTLAQLNARLADPRNDAMDPKFDPAYAEETRQGFRKLYPNES